MSRLLRLSLILLLVVTGVALGHARGQSRIAGQVVLCAGGTITTRDVDADGAPVPLVHVCPDMALSVLAGLSPEAAVPSAPSVPRRARRVPAGASAIEAERDGARARGPPSAA